MRKLTVAAFTSLDGVMQAPGGPGEDDEGDFRFGGWIVPFSDEMVGEAVGELFDGTRELVLGRRTYDIFSKHWPRLAGDPFADGLNRMRKHVATRSSQPLEWQNSHVLGPDAISAMRNLKSTEGPDLFTQGSSELVHALLAAGLVDTLRVLIFPVVLGTGKRLFDGGSMSASLRLIDSRTTSTGAIVATYDMDGAIRTGSFALA